MRLFFAAISLFSIFSLSAQEGYPQDAFTPPLDIPLILAGSFGELRADHFHAGMDIKTQQRQGLPVHAVADGTVTRINVSLWGYGKVLYIAHPNGYTSVYGHLQKFSPEIEAYIHKLQYEKKSYEVEAFPSFGELTVHQGELIAYSGDTGGSAGPHLHFEIRKSVNQRPTNPLLYGFDVKDATDPVLQGVYAYALSEDGQVNRSNGRVQLHFSRQADGSYRAAQVMAAGTIGFGVEAFDRQDLAANHNGLYGLKQTVNGQVYSELNMESFSFPESRYINTLIDYAHYARTGHRIERCFKVTGNHLDIYKTLYNNGELSVEEGLTYNVEIDLFDIEGNNTKLIIPVVGRREALLQDEKPETTPDLIVAQRPNNFDLGAAKVYFPADTFYDNFYIDLQKGADTVKIHNNTVPAHRNFTITFDVTKYTPEEQKQLFIARLGRRGEPQYETTYKRGNTFTTRTRNLGTYTLAKDTVPPIITPRNFKPKQWLTNYHYLSVRIADNLSGIDTYNATLNGQWILMEYEPKTQTLTYNFDDKILDQTECNLEIVVTDNVGNTSTYTTTFYRK